MEKLCRICGKLKDIDNFVKNDKMIDGHRNECKGCSNNLYNNKKRRRELNLEKDIKNEGSKVCRICKKDKFLVDFHIKRGTPDGHRNECKECVKEIQKKYKEDTDFKGKNKIYHKKRYDEKRDELLEKKKIYYQKNREKLLDYKKEYRDKNNNETFKKWRENNLDVMANHQTKYRKKYPHVIAWRSILHSTLKRLGTSKEGHTIYMLGYSALDLKKHIEKQFLDGMTWDNHGEWHIDHIKAVTTYENTTSVKEVCALENLQPLWAFDNLSKNRY